MKEAPIALHKNLTTIEASPTKVWCVRRVNCNDSLISSACNPCLKRRPPRLTLVYTVRGSQIKRSCVFLRWSGNWPPRTSCGPRGSNSNPTGFSRCVTVHMFIWTIRTIYMHKTSSGPKMTQNAQNRKRSEWKAFLWIRSGAGVWVVTWKRREGVSSDPRESLWLTSKEAYEYSIPETYVEYTQLYPAIQMQCCEYKYTRPTHLVCTPDIHLSGRDQIHKLNCNCRLCNWTMYHRHFL